MPGGAGGVCGLHGIGDNAYKSLHGGGVERLRIGFSLARPQDGQFVQPSQGYGEMAEWSIAADSKSAEPQGSGGSNPSLSASLGYLD